MLIHVHVHAKVVKLSALVIQLHQVNFRRFAGNDWLCNARELVSIVETEEAARNISQAAQILLSQGTQELLPLTM